METKDINNEATEFQTELNNETVSSEAPSTEKTKSSVFSKGSAAVGAGFGILLGSTAAFLSACSIDAAAAEHPNDQNTGSVSDGHPEWSDGEVSVSSSVNDDMSFSEAFSAARAELGPGAAFEWHGNVYGTYTAEEWDAMTPEQRQEFQDHFTWTSSDSENGVNEDPGTGSDILVNPEDVEVAQEQDVTQNTEVIEDVEVVDTSEVEILGVVQDTETGANFGFLNIDGQDVVLADLDSDGEFDVIAADLDGNGEISPDEMEPISDAHIQVSDLASNGIGTDSMYAMNDGTPDYVNDADAGGFDNLV